MLCQAELVDLLPEIEEANAISIALDKKVVFSALPVSASARYSSINIKFFYFKFFSEENMMKKLK